MMKLLLIEGMPGSGKSTTAERLCDTLIESGIHSKWYREEEKAHPVHPRIMRNYRNDKKYPVLCLKSWKKFVEDQKDHNVLHIMEGSAFQSTVRYMPSRF